VHVSSTGISGCLRDRVQLRGHVSRFRSAGARRPTRGPKLRSDRACGSSRGDWAVDRPRDRIVVAELAHGALVAGEREIQIRAHEHAGCACFAPAAPRRRDGRGSQCHRLRGRRRGPAWWSGSPAYGPNIPRASTTPITGKRTEDRRDHVRHPPGCRGARHPFVLPGDAGSLRKAGGLVERHRANTPFEVPMSLRLTPQDEIAVWGVPSWSGRRRDNMVPRVRFESDAGASGTPHCCFEHVEQSREHEAPPDQRPPHDGGTYGTAAGAMRRTGRPQEDRGGVRAGAGSRRQASPPRAHVRHDGRRPLGLGGLARHA